MSLFAFGTSLEWRREVFFELSLEEVGISMLESFRFVNVSTATTPSSSDCPLRVPLEPTSSG